MLELSERKELGPLMGVIGAEDTEIGFDFLVGPFCLSVSLRMVCGGKSDIIFEDSGKFSGECRSKLRSPVRDKSIMESKTFEYVIEKELGNTIRINGF